MSPSFNNNNKNIRNKLLFTSPCQPGSRIDVTAHLFSPTHNFVRWVHDFDCVCPLTLKQNEDS
jgi:hypothetical protein